MSLIGKGSTSFRKKDVLEQKSIALGFKKIRFAHKATAGASTINLAALVTPTEMSANGFTNPSVADITKANIMFYRNNLKLVSSLRGLLVDQLSYVISNNLTITLLDFTAEDGEIFQGWMDETPSTSLTVVDGQTIVASGILAAGQTDFNIGTPIEINKNPSTQMGAVMVFADRGLQYRKAGNITTGDGDYIEVPVAGGLGSLIRFNASGSDRFITVVSNGVVAERPDGSMMAAIERVQGQIDSMVPTLAAVAGVPETDFQSAPNNVDLKQFGDKVLSTAYTLDKILDIQVPVRTSPQNFPSVAAGTLITSSGTNPTYGTVSNNVATWYRDGGDAVITWNYHQTTAGSLGSGIFYFNIPAAIGTIDLTRVKANNNSTATNVYHDFDSGLGFIVVSTNIGYLHMGAPQVVDATRLKFPMLFSGASSGALVFGDSTSSFNTANCAITLTMRVPISGWTQTQSLRSLLGS